LKLTNLPGLGPARIKTLSECGIETAEDLLMIFPYRYIDRSRKLQVRSLTGREEQVTLTGRISDIREIGRYRKKRLEMTLEDDSGSVKGVWFRGGAWIRKKFNVGDRVSFFGTVRQFGRSFTMAHPEVEKVSASTSEESENRQKIFPVYPSDKRLASARINSRLLHHWIVHLLNQYESLEFLPEETLRRNYWPERSEAFRKIHNPQYAGEPEAALERFKFEELFLFELAMARIRQLHFKKSGGPVFGSTSPLTRRFLKEVLPFSLTDGQRQALRDIRKDLISGYQMNRLIQGDVGSGKTVIAITSMLMALDNGYQAAFMAPTEILAEQHYHTLNGYLQELGVEIRLLTGGQSSRLRTDILTGIEGGQCRIVVGTHALIQESVRFNRLGLAVIDEQHRFGVKQRAEILNKGDSPHLLVMSATPIPRSLALSIYSDLDISWVRGLPAGRKPVRTAVRYDRNREEIYHFLEQSVLEGGQAYIIFPLIEESEVMDLKDATRGYEKLQRRFPHLSIGLVHGRMSSEEKEEVMNRFYEGELQILVSTTVIEVGVDVPNASIMIIEQAERFGLSQLHQLRGRIGRGSVQSYCILMPGSEPGESGRYRLNKMVETSDGFEIAEADLKLRGPGDFLGTRQSGLPEFQFADIIEDQELLEQARDVARKIMESDPQLQAGRYQNLRAVFEPYYRERSEYYGLG